MKKKIFSAVLAMLLLMSASVFAAAPAAYAANEPLKNVTISSSGILSWNAFNGAAVYYMGIGVAGMYLKDTSIDLFTLCDSEEFKSGTYTVTLYALNGYKWEGGSQISETWTGKYVFKEPQSRLATPSGVKWNGDVANWNAVSGAKTYELRLYVDSYPPILIDPIFSPNLYLGDYYSEGTHSYRFGVVAKAQNKTASREGKSPTVTRTLELQELSNVRLSNGVLSWDEYYGARTYYYRVGSMSGFTDNTSVSLRNFCSGNGYKSGTYEVILYAMDNYANAGGRQISATWRGSYAYSSSSSYKPGDLDKDGKITTADALIALKMAVGIIKPTNEQKTIADVDKDGKITTADALLILKYAVGIIKSF
ncbi:MAG: dockerin type I repeat-containing protein [Clostridia bacterium]|nr:dockerin type I repeat-containing protein [Clostridia bacterium]